MQDDDRLTSNGQAGHVIAIVPVVAICAFLGGLLLFGGWLLRTETAIIASMTLLGAMVHLCCVSTRE